MKSAEQWASELGETHYPAEPKVGVSSDAFCEFIRAVQFDALASAFAEAHRVCVDRATSLWAIAETTENHGLGEASAAAEFAAMAVKKLGDRFTAMTVDAEAESERVPSVGVKNPAVKP